VAGDKLAAVGLYFAVDLGEAALDPGADEIAESFLLEGELSLFQEHEDFHG